MASLPNSAFPWLIMWHIFTGTLTFIETSQGCVSSMCGISSSEKADEIGCGNKSSSRSSPHEPVYNQ